MSTPEVQQYINQQRAAGISDNQIRQNLVEKGWKAADVDQTLVGTSTQTSPPPTSKSYGKLIIILLIIFVGLPALIWGSMFIFGYYKFTHSGIAVPLASPSLYPTYMPGPTGQNTGSIRFWPKLCGNWPSTQSDDDYLTGAKFFSKITDSTTTNGIPIYPRAVKIIEVNTPAGNSTIQQVVACAKSTDIPTIANYYKSLGGYTVGEIASLPAAYSINTNLGSLKAVEMVDKPSGVLYIYSAGNGDSLLFYHYH